MTFVAECPVVKVKCLVKESEFANSGRIGYKTYVLYHPIRNCHISFLLKNSIHPTKHNNILINSQLSLIVCGCA